jgi:hypothetical protein
MVALKAQSDTVDTNVVIDYKYEKVGVKHYLTSTTINAKDSTETVTRVEKKSKKDVLDFANTESERLKGIKDKAETELTQMINYRDQLIKELAIVGDRLKDIRTKKKLANDGIDKVKAIK